MNLTQEKLKEVLHYDPTTGIFTWIKSPRSSWVGKQAGYIHTTLGYVYINVFGKMYRAHRLAWLYMIGCFPIDDIDHKNGKRSDNKFENLRDVTRSINMQNQRKTRSKNGSGYLGVHKNRKSFHAKIKIDGKQIHLGTYKTPKLAYSAYLKAKREFHAGNML